MKRTKYTLGDYFSNTALTIVTALLVALFLAKTCGGNNADKATVVNTAGNSAYEIIEVNGMTCVKMNTRGGLTCNWDEWEGKHE